jgi:hypothetical protein
MRARRLSVALRLRTQRSASGRRSGAIVALVLAGAAVGCGDDEPQRTAGDGPATSARAAGASDAKAPGKVGGASPDPRPRESADGTLTTADGEVIRDWGPERDRKLIVARFARMQRSFRAGRMAAVCANVTDFGLAQFTPGRTGFDTPCPAKLRTFATELERRAAPPVRLRVLWVRSYPLVASVWVEDPAGKRIRVGFTDVDGAGMKLELATSDRARLLYGSLAAARRYLAR